MPNQAESILSNTPQNVEIWRASKKHYNIGYIGVLWNPAHFPRRGQAEPPSLAHGLNIHLEGLCSLQSSNVKEIARPHTVKREVHAA